MNIVKVFPFLSPAGLPVKKITGKDSDCPSFVIGKIMIY